jgi:tetratricopeptide (TPR) repeat protein
MKTLVLVVALGMTTSLAAAQTRGQRPAAGASTDRVAEAYNQFLLGHRLEESDDDNGAIAAYKRAMELDPLAADIPAELGALYLRQNKAQEAMNAAEASLKLSPTNREANRVLGTIYAAMSEAGQETGRGRPAARTDENLTKAIRYLEVAAEKSAGESDPNVRATLARLYVRAGAFDKAIPLLTELVNEEPGWQDGPMMLVEAYSGAGRGKEAIAWLEERTEDDPRLLPALADFYERERRWPEAASTYARVLQRLPRNNDIKTRYAAALLNAGGRDNIVKARDALKEVTSGARTPEARPLYLLSQAQRRLGEGADAEASARRVIALNAKSPWGYYALAEALEARRAYQAVVDELSPVVAEFRGRSADRSFDVTVLLPHLGFAYQELGQFDKAIATFEEARKLSPDDPAVASYLVEANIAAKRYASAIDVAKAALAHNPDDLRLARLEAQALRHTGKTDQGITLLEETLKKHADDPMAYISLAQVYSDADKHDQAVKVLQDAQAKFPADDSIAFELGTVFDKAKKFADAETAFRSVLARDPQNATALNYLGYMLAERGERLDESVGYLKRALEIEPDNGSFLDSLGWAYYKSDRLDLAEQNLKRAADQMRTNSVIQDHYGDVLVKLGRYDEAIAAYNRALTGDGDSIDKGEIDRKIRAAKTKLPKK